MQWVLFCLFVITGLMVYFPIVFIRKMDRIQATLNKIERDTHDVIMSMVR